MMSPSPIPRYDNSKLNMSEATYLFGAGREKKYMLFHHIPR